MPFLMCAEARVEQMYLSSSTSSEGECTSTCVFRNKMTASTSFMSFPQILMEILTQEENSDIIGWLPGGKAFMIYQKEKFSNNILPLFFKKTKYTSFTRKLSRWNFNRISNGPNIGAFYHELFQRDSKHLCTKMTCCFKERITKSKEEYDVAKKIIAKNNEHCYNSKREIVESLLSLSSAKKIQQPPQPSDDEVDHVMKRSLSKLIAAQQQQQQQSQQMMIILQKQNNELLKEAYCQQQNLKRKSNAISSFLANSFEQREHNMLLPASSFKLHSCQKFLLPRPYQHFGCSRPSAA